MCLFTPFLSGFYHRAFLSVRQCFLLAIAIQLAACSSDFLHTKKPAGVVSVKEAAIAQNGVRMLEQGGNAADAMSAMLMSGAVVLPSRMGLGAGGVCQVLDPAQGRVQTLNFMAPPMSFDRKIAVPALTRGVYTLQNKYGHKPWREILTSAKSLAQNGITVGETLAKDIITSASVNADWKNKKKGDKLKQPQLAKTLDKLASSGAGVLYSGDLAQSIVNQSEQIVLEDLKNFKASYMDSIDVADVGGKTFFPNPSVLSSDAYMIWRNAQSSKAERRKQALDSMQTLKNKVFPVDEQVQGMGLIAADKNGLVVACTVSMGQVFGSGQLTEQGFYLGAVIPKQDNLSVFANFLQTNPDVTDARDVLVGVGDYALADALNEWSLRLTGEHLIKEEQSEGIENNLSFASMTCEKGYPNQIGSCLKEDDFYIAYEKE